MKRLFIILLLSCSAFAGTPPTLISYTETVWNTNVSSKTSASVSWNSGDIIAVIAGSEGPGTLGVPTATGLTFNSQQLNTAASTCATRLATAVAGSTSSGTISATNSDSTFHWGFGVWVFRGSQGVGNSSEQHTATRIVALTPTAADGAIVWGVFDFSGSTVTNWNTTPTATNVRQRVADGGRYTLYVSDLADQASGGSVSYGIAGTGAGSGPYSIVALEIKVQAGGGGATPSRLPLLGVGQ